MITRTAHDHHLAMLRMVFGTDIVIWPATSFYQYSKDTTAHIQTQRSIATYTWFVKCKLTYVLSWHR